MAVPVTGEPWPTTEWLVGKYWEINACRIVGGCVVRVRRMDVKVV